MENQPQPLTKRSKNSRLQKRKAKNGAFPIKMLPEELQIQILSLLPTDDMILCETVCKQWQSGIKAWTSCRLNPEDHSLTLKPKKPLYMMFNKVLEYERNTYAYNSDKDKWIPFDIPNYGEESPVILLPHKTPLFSENTFHIAASGGLVCFMSFMEEESRYNGFVFNPILKDQIKLLPHAPGGGPARRCAIALSTNVSSRKYEVVIVRSFSVADSSKYNVTIHIYTSGTRSWVNFLTEESVGWLIMDETCVICKDVLYVAAYLPSVEGGRKGFHEIQAYNLSQPGQRTKVAVPCALTFVKLLNLNEKVIMVGAIPDNEDDCIETVAIWELCGNELKEITRAPNYIISHLPDCIDDWIDHSTFIASGCSNLVFVQSSVSEALVSYDLCTGAWKVLPEAPFPWLADDYLFFGGFCFEPRLDILP